MEIRARFRMWGSATVLILSALSVVMAEPASAVSQADQSFTTDITANTPVRNGGGGGGADQWVGEYFTAGVTGSLTGMDLFLSKGTSGATAVTQPLIISVYATSSGLPAGTALATVAVLPSSLPYDGGAHVTPTPTRITFAVPIPITAGTQYAFTAVTSESAGSYQVWSNLGTRAPGTYAMFSSPAGSAWALDTIVPMTFGFVTYLDAAGGRDLSLWQKAYARSSAAEVCQAGWDPSWMQWPNAGKGGFVCVRNTYAYYPNEAFAG